MPRRGKTEQASGGSTGTLAELRKQAQLVIRRLERAGRQQINAIESQIKKLNQQREALLAELSSAIGAVTHPRAGRGKRAAAGPARPARRAGRAQVNWEEVFGKLPKGSFRASDVRSLAPGVAPGTLSQRLTSWVNEKKLRRTGSRRGTRYTKAA